MSKYPYLGILSMAPEGIDTLVTFIDDVKEAILFDEHKLQYLFFNHNFNEFQMSKPDTYGSNYKKHIFNSKVFYFSNYNTRNEHQFITIDACEQDGVRFDINMRFGIRSTLYSSNYMKEIIQCGSEGVSRVEFKEFHWLDF